MRRELEKLEFFSSSAMMNRQDKSINASWNFNILQFCAPGKFGELQGFIDSGLQPESQLLIESKSKFAKLAQMATELAFDAAFMSIKVRFWNYGCKF